MKQQKDWYIGTDYYVDYKEKRIRVERMELTEPLERQIHEQAEMYYILEGSGEALVNGTRFLLKKGSFLCLYMYHFGIKSANFQKRGVLYKQQRI